MEDFILEKILLTLKEFYESDSNKYVSSKEIDFDSDNRMLSMSMLNDLKELGYIEILSITQIPKIRLTKKGYLKTIEYESKA